LEKALEFFRQAEAIWRSLGGRRGQAQALNNVGYVHFDLGDMKKALHFYDQASHFWQLARDLRGRARVLTALGGVYGYLGEKQKALELHNEALQHFQSIGDLEGKAVAFNGIGYVYEDLGEKQKALEFYSMAHQLFETVGNLAGQGGAIYYVGKMYDSLGNKEKALECYKEGLSLIRRLGDRRFEAHMLKAIGMVYGSSGDKAKALDHFHKALSLSQAAADRREQVYTLNEIGYVYDLLGDKHEALNYYKQALPLSRAVEDRRAETVTLHNIARADRDIGSLTEARSQVELAISIVESVRTNVASPDLRSSYFASVRQHYDLYIDLLLRLHQQRPNDRLDAAALQASERARARSLLESLAETRADIRQGIDPALLERERSLRQLLDAKARRQMLPGGKLSDGESLTLSKEIRTLTAEYEELQGLIRSKSPRYAALMQPQPLGLEEIQQQVLDEDTLLLEYALGDEHSYLWAVSQTAMKSYELAGRIDIEKAARHVYDLLIARQPRPGETAQQYHGRVTQADAQYWQRAASLSEMILGPVAGQLGTKRLLIVAEGALQYLPFGALPKPKGRVHEDTPGSLTTAAPLKGGISQETEGDRLVPLIVDHEIVNLPSASVMAVLRREMQQRQRPSKMVAVLADPVFEKDDPRLMNESGSPRNGITAKPRSPSSPAVSALQRKATQRRTPSSQRPASELQRALRDVGISRDGLSVPRLLSTRQEAEAIIEAAAGAGMKATDFKASRATVTSPELGQYRIVHFATHGLLNSEHPELSGLVLSLFDEQGKSQNGFLRLHDIYNLNLPADLVVLSACNTGLGKEVRGEGLVGIVRGFMYAGAARVVASLWKVDDEATAELMKRFYRYMLQEKMPAAAALKAAQVEMWQQKRWRSPYFWAGFVLQGEWR
jgi:tetratricopeptide (TPR) repeat protein